MLDFYPSFSLHPAWMLGWLMLSAVQAQETPQTQLHDLFRAYNAHHVEGMLALMTDDVTWLSVTEDSVAVELVGKEALKTYMNTYFKALPSARSGQEGMLVNGRFVTVKERAFWEQDGETRSQASLAVYEFEDLLIRRVWYYPSQ